MALQQTLARMRQIRDDYEIARSIDELFEGGFEINHRVFDIPELVLEILSWMDTRDQLHFGLTCHTIWRSAVSAIWKHVPSQDVLFHALLILALQVTGVSRPTGVLVCFLRHDGKRNLEYYGSFVRSLVLSDIQHAHEWSLRFPVGAPGMLNVRWPSKPDRLQNVMRYMAEYRGPQILLPHLRTLELRFACNRSILSVLPLLGRPFLRLSVHVNPAEQMDPALVIQLLEQIAQNANGLDFFLLDFPCGGNSQASGLHFVPDLAVVNLLSQLSQVRELSLVTDRDDRPILPVLLTLPYLTTLCVILRGQWEGPPLALPSSGCPFLEDLTLACWSGSQITSFLESISSSSLSRCLCHIGHPSFPFCQMITTCLAHKWTYSLRDVDLNIVIRRFTQIEIDDDRIPDSASSLIRPLLACWQLERFSFANQFERPRFVDEDFNDMTLSWPRLRCLKIREGLPHSGSELRGDVWLDAPYPGATRPSLVWLANRCAQLEQLSMSVDFDLPLDLPFAHASSPLKEFGYVWSRSTRPRQAIVFLKGTFPHLKSLAYYPHSALGMTELRDSWRTYELQYSPVISELELE